MSETIHNLHLRNLIFEEIEKYIEEVEINRDLQEKISAAYWGVGAYKEVLDSYFGKSSSQDEKVRLGARKEFIGSMKNVVKVFQKHEILETLEKIGVDRSHLIKLMRSLHAHSSDHSVFIEAYRVLDSLQHSAAMKAKEIDKHFGLDDDEKELDEPANDTKTDAARPSARGAKTVVDAPPKIQKSKSSLYPDKAKGLKGLKRKVAEEKSPHKQIKSLDKQVSKLMNVAAKKRDAQDEKGVRTTKQKIQSLLQQMKDIRKQHGIPTSLYQENKKNERK